MNNGVVERDSGGELAEKLDSLAIGNEINGSSNSNDGLFQVIKAVEAAEATIKQQVEENNRLRSELQRKTQELEKYKLDNLSAQVPHFNNILNGGAYESQKELLDDVVDPSLHTLAEKFKNNDIEGPSRMLPSSQVVSDNTHVSDFSSPCSTSLSASRHPMQGDYDFRLTSYAQETMPMEETNNSIGLSKQADLVAKIQEHKDEILQLRKRLSEYSIKEAQIHNEKFVLEKRIAQMRMAFDQQQQDLVDAAYKAISYRQDIVEKNIHLTYALQDAQLERTTFISSLLPLLTEYSFQPPVADAQSIVSNLKVLFKHLQERLILTEAKLKESGYQLAAVHSDANPANFSLSPSYSGIKNGLELVPQPTYFNKQIPMPLDPLTARGWDLVGNPQSGLDVGTMKNLPDASGRYSPLVSRNNESQVVPPMFAASQGEPHPMHKSEETTTKQVTFSDHVSREMDDPDMEGHHNEGEAEMNWPSKTAAYAMQDDVGSSYPHLPPVFEEPSSSFSEAADDDPLPAIEGLQISGEAFPGIELQACGYSINGTTSCNFEWVRHLEDGSINYIEGAKQPNYLVTADDVGTYLAIEVQPLDDRKRKGELVKVFANENKKITCDLDMQSHIEDALYTGHASYNVSLCQQLGHLDVWEPATLAIKREGYSIKCSGPNVIAGKFARATLITIPYGSPTDFSIIGSGGVERMLRSEDKSCSRDTIVLTLRLFIVRAGEKRKGKKLSLFFKNIYHYL